MGNPKVQVDILSDSTNFQKGVKKASDSSSTLEKALKKLGPVGGVFQSVLDKLGLSSITTAAGIAGGLAAAVSLSTVAVEQAITRYVELADKIRSYAGITGQSVEQSSRQVEAFQELGVAEDVAQNAMFRLSRTAEETPGKLAKLGVQVAKDAKGNIDLNATLLSVMTAYQGTSDAGQRAAIVFAAFGKAGQGMIPILETNTAQLQALEAQVNKVYTQKDLDAARKYSIEQKTLGQNASDVANSIAQGLVGALADLFQNQNALIYANKRMDEAFAQGKISASELRDEHSSLRVAYEKEYIASQDAKAKLEGLTQAQKDAAQSAKDMADAENTLYDAIHKSTDANFALEQANIDLKNAQKAVADESLNDRAAAQKITDARIALNDAIKKYGPASHQARDAQIALAQAQDKAGQSGLQAEEDYLRLREAYVKVADAAVAQAEAEAEAGGGSLSAGAKADIYRQSLEDLAGSLDQNSPLRKQLQAYIDQLNSIPSAKNTTIGFNTARIVAPSGSTRTAGGTKSFDGGGMVPGPPGAPMPAIVHGGEGVFTPEQLKALANGGGGDMSETNALLRQILSALATPPGGQTGVEAALHKATHLANTNRARGMAGA